LKISFVSLLPKQAETDGITAHIQPREGYPLQVLVRDNNIDQALRVLKKKMQREGVFREMKQRKSYEKPSERKNREKSEAIRRGRKLARKKAVREGLLPDPKKKLLDAKNKLGQRPGMGDRGAGMGDRAGPRRSF
jgi:small subunit ribosomal protein S21